MKKMLILALVGAMVLPGMAFADAPEHGEARHKAGRHGDERRVEKAHVRHETLLDAIETYAPERADAFDALFEEEQALKLELRDHRDEKREEMKTFFEELKAKLDAGELTREEMKAQLDARRDADRAEREALMASYGLDRESGKALKDALRDAIDSEDAAAFNALLDDLYTQVENRINFLESTK
ncbi:hypothetical protein ACR6HW_02895 [Fusibacter sp. JL298sf-3]